jgi:hypothetical protein
MVMKRFFFAAVVFLGCLREGPAPQVQPEPSSRPPSAQTEGHTTAPIGPTIAAAAGAQATAPAAPSAPGTAQRFGAPITLTETTELAAIVANPGQFSGRPIRTEGTVTAVCQSAGCWMQISDAAQRVHVKMHGHSFFIPRNAAGRRARVQGTVVGGNPNGHCEQEAAEMTGHQAAQRLEIDATGVELL